MRSSSKYSKPRRTVSHSVAEAPKPAFLDDNQPGTVLQEVSSNLKHARNNIALARAAHDIKAPLAIIAGYISLFRTEKLGSLTGEQRDVLDQMHSSCVRLRSIVSEFLTYGVLGTDTRVFNFESGDLNICVEETYREWIGAYETKGVGLRFSAANGLPLLTFDFGKIQQVVSSLLDNALKFTPVGKTVIVNLGPYFWERRHLEHGSDRERRSSSAAAANAAIISIVDGGPGIPAEYQHRLFEHFWAHACGEVRPGTGLGLAIARDIVQAHGGKIWVDSVVGNGSKFALVLPYSDMHVPGTPRGPGTA